MSVPPHLEHFPDGAEQFISHPSHARLGINPFPAKLYVVTMLENPLRWRSRYWNYWMFEEHVRSSGGILYTVEVAFGGRKFEITDPHNPHHLQLRTSSEIWHKENALNLMIQRLPADWKYVACIDADLKFTRPDWCQETLHLLQHYDLIQMFSHLVDMGAKYEPVTQPALGMVHMRDEHPEVKQIYSKTETRPGSPAEDYSGIGSWGCPGGAWAYRRTALDTMGGLIDWMVTGAADFWMAKALYGEIEDVLHKQYSAALVEFARAWQVGAMRLNRNLGHMPGTVNHYYHGPKTKRGYGARRPLLDVYNPLADVKRDTQGLYQLVDSANTYLRDGLREIARSRDEDSSG
jgi:hypothetical protein